MSCQRRKGLVIKDRCIGAETLGFVSALSVSRPLRFRYLIGNCGTVMVHLGPTFVAGIRISVLCLHELDMPMLCGLCLARSQFSFWINSCIQ